MPESDPILTTLTPTPPVEADPSTERFAFRTGTRQAFLLSPELAAALDAGALPADLRHEVEAEIQHLRAYGFWYHPEDTLPQQLSHGRVTVGAHLAHGCNLGCTYCNVHQGTFGDDRSSLMSAAVADASLAFLEDLTVRHEAMAHLVLFGGEPTLNWDVLERLTRGFRARWPSPPSDVWLVTNGTLLDADRARFLAAQDVLTVVSLDGPPEVHNAGRPFRDGRGSYDATVRGLQHVRDAAGRFTIRATWVPGQSDREATLKYLWDLAPDAMQVTVGVDFYADTEGMGRYQETLRWEWEAFRASGYRSRPPASAGPTLDQVLRADWAPRSGCDAGRGGFSVTPDGTIYGCQVAADKKFHPLGSVTGDGLDPAALQGLREAWAWDIPSGVCATCPASTICGGPCHFQRPLRAPLPTCETVVQELGFALQYAARVPLTALTGIYRLRAVGEADRRAFERGAAIRGIAWTRHRHLRPLAICPGPGIGVATSPSRREEEVA